MIDGVLLLWFILTFASLLFVLYDQFTNTPSMRIITLAWALLILYTGPLGLFLYFLSCRGPMKGTHDAFIQIHWKQAVGSLYTKRFKTWTFGCAKAAQFVDHK